MTQDTTQPSTPAQAAQEPADSAQKNVAPQLPDALELPPMLRNTDALEALMKKAAGQLS